MRASALIACPECDLLQQDSKLPPDGAVRCARCAALLYRRSGSLEATLAFALTGALLFVLANAFPIVTIELQGSSNTTTLLGAVNTLYAQGRPFVGALVLVTAILVPALQLGALIYMLLPLQFGRVPPRLGIVLRVTEAVRPWSMVEVFMLGVIVAVVRLSVLAGVVPGIALWSFAGLILLLSAAAASFSVRDLWARAAAIP